MTDDQLVIAKLRKNTVSEIWVSIKIYSGKRSCDIREYFHPADAPEWLPTRKGVSIPVEMLPEAIDAVADCAERATPANVAEFARGKKAKTCFAVCEFKGHMYGEIRTHYKDNENGEWKPGKGVTIPLGLLRQLADALRIAEDHAKHKGTPLIRDVPREMNHRSTNREPDGKK